MDTDLAQALDELTNATVGSVARLHARFDELEKRQNRSVLGGPASESGRGKESPEYKSFLAYARHGKEGVSAHEFKNLVVSDDTAGGYLSPPEFGVELIKNIVPYSPVREAARVGQTARGEVKLPKRTGTMTAQWVGEIEQRPSTGPTYGQITYPVNEMAAYIDVSTTLLEDSAIDLGAELISDFAEEFGRLEGSAFVNGDSVKKPFGFMADPDVSFKPSLASTSITPDGLIDLYHGVLPFYRARGVWMMNSKTLSAVRKLKDGDGQYLVSLAGINNAPSTMLLGAPIVEACDMPDIAAGSYRVVFGDFLSGYQIYDRVAMSILRDPFSLATTGQIRFHGRRRLAGGTRKAEALVKLKIAAS